MIKLLKDAKGYYIHVNEDKSLSFTIGQTLAVTAAELLELLRLLEEREESLKKEAKKL